ncbi:hypothetical protein HUO09_13085 [Vibrio sp. Y2-5]|uniref:hypothetical protein n=1 Tax=Vibrio sp. Y2-5 TaxID=2743977 RepID=UPI0016609B59|nr:hypothetical protein [Vibrio sp. Y2-5]MBD0787282.1 hypothetical protein [Vibrio sp. Y2-5]
MLLIAKIRRVVIDVSFIYRWLKKEKTKRNNDAVALSKHLKKDIGVLNDLPETEHYSKYL